MTEPKERDEIELTPEDEAILDRIWESDAIRDLKPRAELFADMDEVRKGGFDPNQPRDDEGQWTDTGGGVAGVSDEPMTLPDFKGESNDLILDSNAWFKSLSEDEELALNDWFESSEDFNNIVAGDDLPLSVQSAFNHFRDAVNRAPQVNSIVYRGIQSDFRARTPDEIIEGWKNRIGQYITWEQYSSTSLDPEIAARYSISQVDERTRANPLFIIQSKSARYIARASEYSVEKEAVLLPNVRYRVVGVRPIERTYGVSGITMDLPGTTKTYLGVFLEEVE